MKTLFSKLTCVLLLVLVMAMGAFVGYGCSDTPDNTGGEDPETSFSLTLSETNISALIGDTKILKVTNASRNAEIDWKSSNESVVSVDDGKIEALREGSAKITATYKGFSAECNVNVGFGANLPQLLVKNAGDSFKIGMSQTAFPLEVVVLFNGREFSDVEFTYDSAEQILAFDQDGNITPKATGKEEIALTATWRGYSIDRFPTLFTKVEIEVVDEIFFWVNGAPVSDIELYTLPSHDGVNYTNSMDFNITGELNGQEIPADEIEIRLPEFLERNSSTKVLTSIKQGVDKIYFAYNDLVSAVNVTVKRITDKYEDVIDYYSLNVGTYKDSNDGWKDKTVVDTVFAGYDEDTYSLDTLQAYYGSKKIELTADGKVFGLPFSNASEYTGTVTFQTDRFSIDVDLVVYGLVIKEANDLKKLQINIIKNDDPSTPGLDETEATCIDGYCVLLNSVDATGIKIEHGILEPYDFVDKDGNTVERLVTPSRYRCKNPDRIPFDDGVDKFGFVGNFDGRGNTIFNLDVSVPADAEGAGLFCYTLGGVKIYDLGFKNLNCSNSCGLAINTATFAPLGGSIDPLGLRADYSSVQNVYIHLSPDTVNPKGALTKEQTVGFGHRVNQVIVDASEVKMGDATVGGVLVNKVSTYFERQHYSATNIYVISPEVPAAYNEEYKLVGKNVAGDIFAHDQKANGNHYAHDIYTYNNFEELVAGNHDFASFSSSWLKLDYPIFLSAKEVAIEYNGLTRYDDKVTISNYNQAKPITLKSIANTTISDVEYVDYDSSKLTITKVNDVVYNIKLAQDLTDYDTTSLTINYKSNGRAGTLKVEVTLAPSTIVVSEEYLISSINLNRDIAHLLAEGQKIVSVTQTIEGKEPKQFGINQYGVFDSTLDVEIKPDYSNVKTSELIVATTDLTYKFTNAKVYSHVLKDGSDLSVLNVSASASVKGYYVLGNNINAYGINLTHSDNNDTKFQGVLDGRGYSIYNLKLDKNGLLKHVYSDDENNGGKSIIRNLGIVKASAKADPKDNQGIAGFSIFGIKITANNGAKTEITNVHVHVAETRFHSWPQINNFKGLFNGIPAGDYDTFEMTNVYIDIDNETTSEGVNMTGFGTITAHDVPAFGTSKALRQSSKRFTNVVTIAKSNPSVYRNTYEYEQTLQDNKCYFIYAENTIGKSGGVRIGYVMGSASEIRPIAHPVVSDDIANGSYIYYGVYKYLNESEFAADENNTISIFTDTGYWRLEGDKLVWATMLQGPTDTDTNFDPDWIPGLN